MVDGGHHVALAGQVLRQMAEQETVAGVTMRNYQQRVRAGGGIRCCVAQRLAVQGDLGLAIAGEHTVLAGIGLPRRWSGRVPDLHGERAVIDGNSFSGFRLQDVELPGVGKFERLDANAELAVLRQLGGVGADGIDPVVLCHRRSRRCKQGYQPGGYLFIEHRCRRLV